MTAWPLALFALCWAALQLATSAAAVRRLGKASIHRHQPVDAQPPLALLLVRPVSGADDWLLEALSSSPNELVGASLRVRIAVADVDDPAYPIAKHAVARLVARGFDASLCLTAARGQNRKAAQIAAVLSSERSPADATREIVIVADADVDLSASPLAALLSPFADEGLGATWAPPVEVAPALTLGDRASQALLGGSLHAFPILARLDEGSLVGKLCALRRSSLEAVGGFDTLVPWLGEDMRLAEALHASGIRFAATKQPAVSLANGRSATAVLARYARWLQVIRAQRPWLLLSYPALFFGTFPAIVLCLAVAALADTSWLALLAATLFMSRLVVARAAARAAGRSGSWTTPFVDAVLADALLLCAFFLAATQRHVAWKANRFTFDRRGRLHQAEEAPRAIA